jgi:hypothetical protein
MQKQWESKGLHEHPAKHQVGTFGKIILSPAGVYVLKVGSSHMSCPQDWATKIHAQEQTDSEVDYILKGIPEDLWKSAKKKAIDLNKTMKQVLLDALKKFVEKD